MKFHFVVLWTDALIYLLLITAIIVFLWMRKQEHWREPWRIVAGRKLGMAAFVILLTYVLVGFLDSIHFSFEYPSNAQVSFQSRSMLSVLDLLLSRMGFQEEQTYSSPFALFAASKMMVKENGSEQYRFPRLEYGGKHLKSIQERPRDIISKVLIALTQAIAVVVILTICLILFLARRHQTYISKEALILLKGKSEVAWREMLITLSLVVTVIFLINNFAGSYHLFGTDKVGKDVLYAALKSIRTGLIIGTLTTLVMLPFAIWLGMEAGYFGGWIDDIIQYVYTTLSSIPGVLLISASVLSLQLFIDNHPNFFQTLEVRADVRLLALCIILGITSWTSLCRLLRAETLKLREADFVRAAITMGVPNYKILLRHILPNVMHIILITVVLDFSGLVLAEAVLSYVGVGVDPTTFSWGNMINSARLDFSREPVVWWPLTAAFIFMFTLVLAANLFADAVRDAFDPRLRNVE